MRKDTMCHAVTLKELMLLPKRGPCIFVVPISLMQFLEWKQLNSHRWKPLVLGGHLQKHLGGEVLDWCFSLLPIGLYSDFLFPLVPILTFCSFLGIYAFYVGFPFDWYIVALNTLILKVVVGFSFLLYILFIYISSFTPSLTSLVFLSTSPLFPPIFFWLIVPETLLFF